MNKKKILKVTAIVMGIILVCLSVDMLIIDNASLYRVLKNERYARKAEQQLKDIRPVQERNVDKTDEELRK